ncbi:MAG: protein-L-isoaspartate(D-aspartate) O-methyltransferase [Candidatus Omnitrophica bacterium]|nr:protein-L-isoaspartate(D-aspartate) O-methyltransferase [Candidatus Omnitrophota bacterium]
MTLLAFLLVLICSIENVSEARNADDSFVGVRNQMVERQIRARGIKDERVLEIMRKVPRHEFVPVYFLDQAYEDHPLSIGEGQTISQPYIVALMTELLSLTKDSKILEIGTGSGYQAAVLAELAGTVYTIEIVPKLAHQARESLKRLHYNNVFVREGDGYFGWPEHAPFDAMIITAAPENIPKPLVEHLKEGGRMAIPVGQHPNQSLYLVQKINGRIEKKEIIPVSFVPMVGLIEKAGES